MPRKESAIKELRKTVKRTARNRQTKRRIKDLQKEIITTPEIKKEDAKALYKKLQKSVDKAAKRARPFNKNKASRIKSRMAKKINAKIK